MANEEQGHMLNERLEMCVMLAMVGVLASGAKTGIALPPAHTVAKWAFEIAEEVEKLLAAKGPRI